MSDGIVHLALTKLDRKITSHWSWPFFLPTDTEELARGVYREVEEEIATEFREDADSEDDYEVWGMKA